MFRTSHNYVGVGLLSGTLLAAIISIGCGGRGMQSSSTTTNPNTPAASNPSSSAPGTGSGGGTSSGGSGSSGSGSGSGSGGSGGSGGGSSSYFFAALLSTADSSNHGMITLDTTGGGTVQLQGVAASTSYSVEFCQFPNGTSNCFSVGSGSVSTDSSGNAQTSFTFSRSGNWAGIFLLQPSGGGTGYDSDFPVPGSGTQYQNPLLQAATITGGTPSFWGPDGTDPLSSGFVTITGNNAHITLNGALANSSYTVSFCGNGGGSSCFADLGTVMTDANGNGAADIDTMGRNIPGVFGLGRSDGALQFITGVHVP